MNPEFLFYKDLSRPEYEDWGDGVVAVYYPLVQVFADPWLEAESVRRITSVVTHLSMESQ